MGSVRTTVQMVVEVDGGGKFGGDWRMSDIKKAAVLDAEEKILRVIGRSSKSIKIIGKPKVINFIHSEDL